MDFLLSLSHFCEIHGPTSILCTQVSPITCTTCFPPTPPRSRSVSPHVSPYFEFTTHGDDVCRRPLTHTQRRLLDPASDNSASAQPCSRRSLQTLANTNATLAESAFESGPCASNIENHPYFIPSTLKDFSSTKYRRYSSHAAATEGATCASCDFSLPQIACQRLMSGTAGASPGKLGRGRHGSPVLRSRQSVHACGNHLEVDDAACHDSSVHGSFPDNFSPCSMDSISSTNSNCHNHLVTYLTLHGPQDSASYSLLRRSAIRTLSCELLPRGLSSGPLCFGDSVSGYTIAYIFRLSDSKARGKRRSYALLALAGTDAGRAFRACPVIWRAFHRIATNVVSTVEKVQRNEKSADQSDVDLPSRPVSRKFTQVSSFLTGRVMDPDGYPLRAGTQIKAKGLPELAGNDLIFAEIHAEFVSLLQHLGSMFGGMPIAADDTEPEPEPEREPELERFRIHEDSASVNQLQKHNVDEFDFEPIPNQRSALVGNTSLTNVHLEPGLKKQCS